MRVTLINPPWYFKRGLTNLSQNLSLGYLASYLLSHGHQVEIIDALAEGHNNVTEISFNRSRFSRIGLSYQDIADRISPSTNLIGIAGPFNYLAKIITEL